MRKSGHPIQPAPKKLLDQVRDARAIRLGNHAYSTEQTYVPRQVIGHLSRVHQLMGRLLYGSGLRLMECARLRVKDLGFGQRQIIVRQGKS